MLCHNITEESGILHFAGYDTTVLAEKYGTPVYLMDEKRIRIILGSRIMQRRKQLCIKQAELAEKIGVSNNQISNIENGKSFPKLGNFICICNILNCNADYFLSGICPVY